jgi:hypothetical protein
MQARRPGTRVSSSERSTVRLGAALLSASMVATLCVTPASTAYATPAAQKPTAQPAGSKDPEAAAIAAAAAADERVEVVDYRSETTQVFAEPDGRLTLGAAAVPQRVHREDGSWDDVDLALRPAAPPTTGLPPPGRGSPRGTRRAPSAPPFRRPPAVPATAPPGRVLCT